MHKKESQTCWQRKNVVLVALSLSRSVSALLQLLHKRYLQIHSGLESWIQNTDGSKNSQLPSISDNACYRFNMDENCVDDTNS